MLVSPSQLQGSEVVPRNNRLSGLLCTQQAKMREFICRENLYLPFPWLLVFSLPHHTQPYGYSSFCGQQPPSLTRHMFYCPLKHNAPFLFDIELFIYFPVQPVSPYERLGALGLLRHDLGGY